MSRRNRRKVNKAATIKKASNESMAVSRVRLSELGTGALSRIRADSEFMMIDELRWPTMIGTIEAMKQDHTVSTALDLMYVFVQKAFNDFTIVPNRTSEASKAAADFIKYSLKNMPKQTLREFARSAASFNEYGFSVFEKVYRKEQNNEKYKDWYVIDKFAFRPQGSMSRTCPFQFSDDGGELEGIWQSARAFKNPYGFSIPFSPVATASAPKPQLGDQFIPLNKLIIFNIGGTESNPAGVSPLVGCYRAYREKILIENLEVIGAGKDLGGIIELKIPTQILSKANIDPNSDEAAMVNSLMQDAANAHAGEQAFFILPSDLNAKGGDQYKMTLKGIDGNGKQYSTKDLISDRKKAILDKLGAGFINVGNDDQGSYNLSESKQTIHGHYVQRVIDIIVEGLNKDFIPQALALNDIRLSDDDMPVIKPGLIQDIDMDGFSKFIQRVGAVGYLPKTREVINKILEVAGIDYVIDENITQEELLELLGADTSRSGDGMTAGSNGNGTGKMSSARDNSTANNEY